MKLKPLFVGAALLFAGAALLFYLIQTPAETPDTAAYNDISETLGERWSTLDAHSLPGRAYPVDYAVLDLNGRVLAATRAGLPEASVAAAVRRRDTLLDIHSGGTVVGNVLFYDDAAKALQAKQRVLEAAALIMAALSFSFCLFYTLLLDRRLLRPFRQLNGFARRIAAGDLDLPLKMEKGGPLGPFTEGFDLMRAELRRAREEARRAEQSKKELTASLSHDIRTPAASILATAELALVRTQEPEARRAWETVQNKAEQIRLLINDLFHASLEELEELNVTPKEESSRVLIGLLKAADYRGKAVIPPVPDCLLSFDRLRLGQVFDNIVSNSYKYADTAIRIRFEFDGGLLAVTFSDSGPGAPPESLPFLCRKFYRGPNTAGKSGSGLGLYLSRWLMEKMGGSLSCADRERDGKICGFEVQVRVPLAGAI